jgi:hypothetical protein
MQAIFTMLNHLDSDSVSENRVENIHRNVIKEISEVIS